MEGKCEACYRDSQARPVMGFALLGLVFLLFLLVIILL